MKKICLSLIFTVIFASFTYSQVLENKGVQNYLWTGMGTPTGTPNDSSRDGFRWYGLIDTIQARVDVGAFTIDGMLAWGALTYWDHNTINDFTFVNTSLKPVDFMHYYHSKVDDNNGRRTSPYNRGDSSFGNDSYYLNFIAHPFKGFDAGLGTRLEWSVGPNPTYGAYSWEYRSHVHQGDLRDGLPGAVPVAGFVKYANTYAQKAIAIRYQYEDMLEIGASIPSGFTTHAPAVNVGFEITPVEFLTAAFAYEALFLDDSNLYTGATIRFNKNFIIDAYFAFDNIGANYSNIGRWGTGATVYIGFPSVGLSFKPEFGLTGYGDSDYSLAFFTGGKVNFDFAKAWHLGCWLSFAWGSENAQWHNEKNAAYPETKDYHGGFIFNIRPELSFDINSRHTLAVTTEFQSLTNYRNDIVDSMLIGFYWRYKSN